MRQSVDEPGVPVAGRYQVGGSGQDGGFSPGQADVSGNWRLDRGTPSRYRPKQSYQRS